MKQTQKPWQPDDTQQAIIDCNRGCHLVLAPPGCGKTQILAERIREAHRQGVAYDDMLCLTFTNRAARGMRERIEGNIADTGTADVFVGNVHRYCSHFLFQNNLVPAESAIIDDDTMVSILAMYLQEDEQRVMENYQRMRAYSTIYFFSHLMYEVRHAIPKQLRLHPECITADDVAVMRTICQMEQRPFSAETMTDIYDHNDFYRDFIRSDAFDTALRQQAEQTLDKMRYAHAYEAYKRQNNLLDFEDLLELTYTSLHSGQPYRRYSWIQVDEVQDLNLMQMAIVDALSTFSFHPDTLQPASGEGMLMYLGDEQQAIFSFMGAKQQTLDLLKHRCEGHIHHLGVNHRSPRYLVNLFNSYAVNELHTDSALLPKSYQDDTRQGDELRIVQSETLASEYDDVTQLAISLYEAHPEETTAIIVNANADANTVSRKLTDMGQRHFKVSGTDLFSTPDMKLLLAHLNVVNNDRNFLAWSRLLRGMGIYQSEAAARRFVRQLTVRAMTPADLLVYSGSTYLQQFLRAYEQHDLIVFDTETTGLDVFEDDVIQIAAERTRQGQTIATFSVHIDTRREIPAMLGDTVNPIIEERRHQQLHAPAEAMKMFLDFAQDGILVGHNADYDYHIMAYNLQRWLPEADWESLHPLYFDTLKLARLLRPDLKVFKLKNLLSMLQLEGENSHLADDDVHATVSLARFCYQHGQPLTASQQEYLARKGTQATVKLLHQTYKAFYDETHRICYERRSPEQEPAIVAELRRFYEHLQADSKVKVIDKIDYVYRFLTHDIIDTTATPSLKEQLDRHVMELNTFKEADLCGATTIDERIFVTTIHKAKGLEFDNVIVFDAVDGRIPNYYSENNAKALAEDARKLYVAMSRAKKRLIITHCAMKQAGRTMKPQKLSRFLSSTLSHFQQQ